MAISGQIHIFHPLTDGSFRAVVLARTCRKSFDSGWACMKTSSRGWPRGTRAAQPGGLVRRAGLAAVGALAHIPHRRSRAFVSLRFASAVSALAMVAAMTTPQLAQAAQAGVSQPAQVSRAGQAGQVSHVGQAS